MKARALAYLNGSNTQPSSDGKGISLALYKHCLDFCSLPAILLFSHRMSDMVTSSSVVLLVVKANAVFT